MIRATKIGFAHHEWLPEVEEQLLDCDLVVFGRGRARGRGRWSGAVALRCSGPGADAPALLHLRADGLALVAGLDDDETLRLARSLPDPVVVVGLLTQTGTVRAALGTGEDAHRFLVVDLADRVAKVELTLEAGGGLRGTVHVNVAVWESREARYWPPPLAASGGPQAGADEQAGEGASLVEDEPTAASPLAAAASSEASVVLVPAPPPDALVCPLFVGGARPNGSRDEEQGS